MRKRWYRWPQVATTLSEIREWVRQALGVDRVPLVWRALAHHPRLLEATWRKDRLVFSAGTLDEPRSLSERCGPPPSSVPLRDEERVVALRLQLEELGHGFGRVREGADVHP